MRREKVAAVMALHYGRDYLAWSIRSIIQDIDELFVLYSSEGSHGTRTDTPCPETEEELWTICHAEAGDKLRWTPGIWQWEGQQRDTIYKLSDAGCIVTLDADEVWHPQLLSCVIADTEQRLANRLPAFGKVRVPMRHYWRSMSKAICHDPAYPVRVVFPYLQQSETTYIVPTWMDEQTYRIHHFGYAQRSEVVGYKMLVHGHKNELCSGWFDDVFMTNQQTDCHPVGSEYWNAETVEPPFWMRDHPYYSLDVIP